MIAVFDTNLIIDALNGVAEADTEYNRYERVLLDRVLAVDLLHHHAHVHAGSTLTHPLP